MRRATSARRQENPDHPPRASVSPRRSIMHVSSRIAGRHPEPTNQDEFLDAAASELSTPFGERREDPSLCGLAGRVKHRPIERGCGAGPAIKAVRPLVQVTMIVDAATR